MEPRKERDVDVVADVLEVFVALELTLHGFEEGMEGGVVSDILRCCVGLNMPCVVTELLDGEWV